MKKGDVVDFSQRFAADRGLAYDLIGEQERVTLWHELIHAERGHDGSISHEEHEDVQREACRRARVSFADYPYLGADRG